MRSGAYGILFVRELTQSNAKAPVGYFRGEANTGQYMRIDLRSGDFDYIDAKEREHHAVRLVRRKK